MLSLDWDCPAYRVMTVSKCSQRGTGRSITSEPGWWLPSSKSGCAASARLVNHSAWPCLMSFPPMRFALLFCLPDEPLMPSSA